MTKIEVQRLDHGVYRIYWKTQDNYTVGAIGSLPNGDRWMISANWVNPRAVSHESAIWDGIEKVELIEKMEYDQKQTKEDLTTTGFYKVQISNFDILFIKGISDKGNIMLSLSKLLGALRECGYQITEPPSKVFTELKEFLDTHDCFSQVDSVGNTIFVYIHNIADRKLSIARTDSRTQVSVFIRNTNDPVFVGHVESLDEFKLIWNRII
jgi:hypothetical protein